MSKEAEVVTKGKKSIFVDFHLAVIVQVGQYPPVLSQQSMNVSYKIVCIAV
jgi:hypothetical protein